MEKKLFIIAAIFSGLGVGIGAFGAHALNEILSSNNTLETYKTAVSYLFYHSFALFALSWATVHWKQISFKLPAVLFICGIILFSGSLLIYSVSLKTSFALITPIGGILLLVAWFLIIYKLIRDTHEQSKKR